MGRNSKTKEPTSLCLLSQLSIFLIPFKLKESVMKLGKLVLVQILADSSVIFFIPN